jgi:predicted secreted protein
MTIITGIVVYVVTWWVVLFVVLPWGVESSKSGVPGEMPGAPEQPRILLKFSITSGITTVLWVVIYLLVTSDVISFRELAMKM